AEAAAAEVARLALETAARKQEEVRSAASLEERAAALFKDLAPPSPAVEVAEAPTTATPLPPPVVQPPTQPPPRPFIPMPVRPRPVARGATAGPGGSVPPRPVASAAPGAPPLDERRREKGKKRDRKSTRLNSSHE